MFDLILVNIAKLESKLVVISEPVGVSAYDFDFDLHFACTHPYLIETEMPCVLRTGPIRDYEYEFRQKLTIGLRLVNSPAEHTLASELEQWYPRIPTLTPRTQIFDTLPAAEAIEAGFQWPVFLKGSRQTSQHNPELSIIKDRAQYEVVAHAYRNDPILHWQKPVVREFIPLKPVPGQVVGKIPPSLEYRTFWWFGECVGYGRYWYQVPPYECHDLEVGLLVAKRAAQELRVPFLVVDIAKTIFGRWIVIECNDAQESGYAGVNARQLWQNVLAEIGS